MSVRGLFLSLFALFSALMLGLAAGAVWMVMALYTHRPLSWLALPLGVALALTIRGTVQRAGNGAMLLSVGATALAVIYVNMLFAGVEIAGNMGLGLIDALRTAGISMLWQLARMSLGPADLIWGLLGIVAAAWLARRNPRRR